MFRTIVFVLLFMDLASAWQGGDPLTRPLPGHGFTPAYIRVMTSAECGNSIVVWGVYRSLQQIYDTDEQAWGWAAFDPETLASHRVRASAWMGHEISEISPDGKLVWSLGIRCASRPRRSWDSHVDRLSKSLEGVQTIRDDDPELDLISTRSGGGSYFTVVSVSGLSTTQLPFPGLNPLQDFVHLTWRGKGSGIGTWHRTRSDEAERGSSIVAWHGEQGEIFQEVTPRVGQSWVSHVSANGKYACAVNSPHVKAGYQPEALMLAGNSWSRVPYPRDGVALEDGPTALRAGSDMDYASSYSRVPRVTDPCRAATDMGLLLLQTRTGKVVVCDVRAGKTYPSSRELGDSEALTKFGTYSNLSVPAASFGSSLYVARVRADGQAEIVKLGMGDIVRLRH